MRINFSASNFHPSFSRALTTREEADFKQVTNEAKKALNIDNGTHMFKVFQTSLPSSPGENLGIGKINSKSADEYLDFMTLYTGSNAVKIYPAGQTPSSLRFPNYYCPYERSSTAIGEDSIDFFKLTEDKYGALLTRSDVLKYRVADNLPAVDYENELESKNGADFKLISKAYHNMMSKNTPQSEKIREEFFDFKKSLNSDTLDRLAIAPYVKDFDKDLFSGFEKSKEKQERFEGYKKQYADEIDIFKFGKFLAKKNLLEARERLNSKGIELFGDCPIGFSADEVFAFPDAFYPENITPGWGFRAIRYEDIPKENTAASRLFKEKISWHLEIFDGIRFDVGWQYFSPKLLKIDENLNRAPFPVNVGDKILKSIEKTAKSIKGDDFDTKKLMYECDADADSFQMFDWQEDGKPVLRKIMKGRTPVLTSVYEHVSGYGWANPEFFKKAGMKDFMLGTNNHDSTPLRALAEDKIDDKGDYVVELPAIREDNVKCLSKTLNLSEKWLRNPKNFMKAKFAELFLAKNHFVFFNDVIGQKARMDKENTDPNNYRYRISNNYEKEYHTALQSGRGFNLAESLRLAMRAKSLDEMNPKLYEKIKHYSEVLYSKGPKTKQEADKLYA